MVTLINNFVQLKVGDIVKVFQKINEGKKDRIITFQGKVINKKGSGLNSMFTVRQIIEGIVVDRIYPYNSPTIEKINFVEKPKKKVKKANLENKPFK